MMKAIRIIAFVLMFSMLFTFVACDVIVETEESDEHTTETVKENKTKTKESEKKETEAKETETKATDTKEAETKETETKDAAIKVTEPKESETGETETKGELPEVDKDKFTSAQMNFALKIFKETVAEREDSENQLISPLSVMLALAMTANGAKSETLAEMEETLGGLSVEELTSALKAYVDSLPEDEKYKLHIANSIWLRDDAERLTVKEDFWAEGREYFDAEIRKEPFDEGTLSDINGWVEDKTDGMIKNILDEIPIDAVLYLINALTFDAMWGDTYDDYQIMYDEFNALDGSVKKVKMMESYEYKYIRDSYATGFIKNYAYGKYAFVALLPNESVNIYDYIEQLDPTVLYNTVSDVIYTDVKVRLPQFSYSYDVEMKPILSKMGMTSAFDHTSADFSDMAVSSAGNIAISRVLHKTFIDVTQYGTRAGAATVVEPTDESAPDYENAGEVILDRPFVYMIIECENNLPIFMGTVIDFENAETVGSVRDVELSYSDALRCGWYEREEYFERFGDVIENPNEGAPIIRIDSAEELDFFESKLRWNGAVLKNYEGSVEEFFESNSLFVIYVEMGSGSIELEVDSATLKDTVTGSRLEIGLIERCPEAFTEDMAGWLACVGIPKALLDTTNEYIVKFSLGEYIEEAPNYDTSPACIRIDSCGFLQDRFGSLVDFASSSCPIMRIDSLEELNTLTALLSAEDGSFMLDNEQGDVSYNEFISRFDDGYFEEYRLVIIYVTENSGSNTLVLRDSTHSQKGQVKTLNFKIARILPGEGMNGTCDMAGWFVCATVNRIYAEDDVGYKVEFIDEYYTAWE